MKTTIRFPAIPMSINFGIAATVACLLASCTVVRGSATTYDFGQVRQGSVITHGFRLKFAERSNTLTRGVFDKPIGVVSRDAVRFEAAP